ncbi:substrate-binding periplasmic protein [Pseudomonas sp. ICMP 561]|uniref:substrate-binding periplasmic protein n=1 Tax=Pseudomonas sp. ICMP 561 TaxID=1718918 RepID=UPI001C54DB30|nr:ABC transporter substrate-binding protein [Pseudomonas sp. ICMP 561]
MNRIFRKALLICTSSLMLASAGLHAEESEHPQDKPLIVGSDFGVAPWIMRGTSGPEGFGVDLVSEISKRLKRPGVEIVDINFSGLFAGLFSKRIEFTVNPTTITAERSERMLFSQPIMSTGNGFMVKAANDMKGFDDLKGKDVAVNRGTMSDTWATANAEKYGFNVQRYDTFPDTVQALMTNRAFTAINEVPTTVYAASKNKAIKVAFKDLSSPRNFGYAFRLDNEEYRNKVDDVIKCMKMDGTMARLHEKWYGAKPEDGSAVTTVYPGYGAPGFKGYVPTSPAPVCN